MIAQLLLLTKKSLPRVRALADIQVSTITIGWNNVDWQSCTRAIRYTHTRDYTFVQKSQDTFRSFVDNEIFEPYTCFIVELLIYIYQNFAGFFAAKISNFETNTYHLRLLSMYLHPWILFLFRLRIFWSFSFFLLFFFNFSTSYQVSTFIFCPGTYMKKSIQIYLWKDSNTETSTNSSNFWIIFKKDNF